MQVVDQPASRLESLDFWKVNMERLKSVYIFRTARLISGIRWILRQNERREQKVPFFGWLVPSVNMRGLSKRFYYDFPPKALFHWRRHLRKEKSWDSKSQEKVSTSEFKRGGGEGNHFEKGCKRAKENSWDENGKSKPIEENEKLCSTWKRFVYLQNLRCAGSSPDLVWPIKILL